MHVQAIIADLNTRYPAGYRMFTQGGKWTRDPVIYPTVVGWKVNVNGQWHMFDRHGRFLSDDTSTNYGRHYAR